MAIINWGLPGRRREESGGRGPDDSEIINLAKRSLVVVLTFVFFVIVYLRCTISVLSYTYIAGELGCVYYTARDIFIRTSACSFATKRLNQHPQV